MGMDSRVGTRWIGAIDAKGMFRRIRIAGRVTRGMRREENVALGCGAYGAYVLFRSVSLRVFDKGTAEDDRAGS
jgi:hypothetical protein